MQQRTLFPTRDELQAILDAAPLQLPGTAPRTARTIKRLLWALETSPQDCRTAEILGAKMGSSPRTYRRALAAAQALGVVTVTHRPGDSSDIRVDWTAVRRLAEMAARSDFCPPGRNSGRPVEILAARSKFWPPLSVDQTPTESGTSDDSAQRHADCVAHACAMNVECMSCMHEGEEGDGDGKDQTPVPRLPTGLAPGGWPERITAATLRDPSGVARLFTWAAARGWVAPSDRVAFHALALAVARASATLKNPGGAFTARVKARDWSPAKPSDWKAAEAAANGPPAAPPPAPRVDTPPEAPRPEIDPQERRERAAQVRRLLSGIGRIPELAEAPCTK